MRRDASRRWCRAALVPAVLVLTLTACGDDKEAAPKAGERPSTHARIQILEPTPFQETGPDVTVKVNLIGAKEVPQVTGEIKPDEGHIHVAVDNNVVAMAFGDSQTITGLSPGKHAIQVDFVAVDHQPFKNRVTAGVVFTVK